MSVSSRASVAHDAPVVVSGKETTHLCPHVLETGRADETETHEEDVRLRVAEGAQPVVILLSSRIPETEVDGLAVHHDISRVLLRIVQRGQHGCEGTGRVRSSARYRRHCRAARMSASARKSEEEGDARRNVFSLNSGEAQREVSKGRAWRNGG